MSKISTNGLKVFVEINGEGGGRKTQINGRSKIVVGTRVGAYFFVPVLNP